MIEYVFAPGDMARVRFAFSPLGELAFSVRVLADPGGHALHLPWVRMVRPRLRDVDMTVLRALVPATDYIADFLTPPPRTPLPEFADELEIVRSTPPAKVAEELAWLAGQRKLPGELLDDPERTLARVADMLPVYWEAAIAPYWTRMRDLMESDVMRRSRALATHGAEGLFADLHESVRWHEDRLKVAGKSPPGAYDLAGRGLVLVPSVFGWPNVLVMLPPYQPTISYPPYGVATLWETGPARPPDALASLIGGLRAAVLQAVGVPASTTELARRLQVSPGAISQHLKVLRECGLVVGRRIGRRVLYVRTAGGDMLAGSGS